MEKNFITEFTQILGDNFFLSDMIWQEELFEKQEKLSQLIAEYANKGCQSAIVMVNNLPMTFDVK